MSNELKRSKVAAVASIAACLAVAPAGVTMGRTTGRRFEAAQRSTSKFDEIRKQRAEAKRNRRKQLRATPAGSLETPE